MMDIKNRDKEEIIQVIISKYFPNFSTEELKEYKSRDIILNLETHAEAINKFRKFIETMNSNENLDAFAYGIPLKIISHYDYTYNNSFNLKNCIQSQKKLKKKYDKDAAIYSVFPVRHLKTHYLSKKDYKLATKLPTVLAKLERYVLPYEMCRKFKININPTNESNKMKKLFSFTFDKLNIFLHATTAPSMMEDYNFESLETLGDSILKFVLSLKLFIENENDSEGELQKKRTDLLKNDKLHEIGLNSKIYFYVLNLPFKISSWEPPFKREMKQKFEQNISKKCMADSVEAIIGACFLIEKNLNTSLNFIQKIQIIDKIEKKKSSNIKSLEEIIYVNSVYLDKFNFIGKENITFTELFDLSQHRNRNLLNLSNCLETDFYPFTNSLLNLDEGHDTKHCNKYNHDNLNLLQEMISYKFKDVSLLVTAFTHQSVKIRNLSNYQRLEFLGDSVLEVYLMIKFFVLFEDKLFENNNENKDLDHDKLKESQSNQNNLSNSNYDLIKIQNFSCGSLTNAKSLLASNYFLMKLSSMLKLQKFLMISDKNKKEQIKNFYNKENINAILNRKSNEYETDPNNCLKPKIISDVFEALLGAILIDSNLEECFKFLDSIYNPFIYYTACFLDSVKYSPISEFIEMIMKLYQTPPKFTRVETENKLIEVEIWINEQLYSKGVAASEDRAKEIASIEGIKKIKNNN